MPRLQQYYDFIREILFGLLIILFIIWEPDGLYKLWLRLKSAVLRGTRAVRAQRGPATGGETRGSI